MKRSLISALAMLGLLVGCAQVPSNSANSSRITTAPWPIEFTLQVASVTSNQVDLIARAKNVSTHPIELIRSQMPGSDYSPFILCAYRLVKTEVDVSRVIKMMPLGQPASSTFVLAPADAYETKIGFAPPFKNVTNLNGDDLALFWHWPVFYAVEEFAGGDIPREMSGAVVIPWASRAAGQVVLPEAQFLEVRIAGHLASGRNLAVTWESGERGIDWVVPLQVSVRNVSGRPLTLRRSELPWGNSEFHLVTAVGSLGVRADRPRTIRAGAGVVRLLPNAVLEGTVEVQLLNISRNTSESFRSPVFWVWNLRHAFVDPDTNAPELLGGSVDLQP